MRCRFEHHLWQSLFSGQWWGGLSSITTSNLVSVFWLLFTDFFEQGSFWPCRLGRSIWPVAPNQRCLTWDWQEQVRDKGLQKAWLFPNYLFWISFGGGKAPLRPTNFQLLSPTLGMKCFLSVWQPCRLMGGGSALTPSDGEEPPRFSSKLVPLIGCFLLVDGPLWKQLKFILTQSLLY